MSLPPLAPPKIKLEAKLLILFILISFLPLFVADLLWFYTSRSQILKSTSSTLTTTTSGVANQVESYFDVKRIGLIIHSQTDSMLALDLPAVESELHDYLLQDADVTELTLLDRNGKELVKIDREGVYPQNQLGDQSNSPAFKVPTFAGGEQYISPIYTDEDGNPAVYMAVPIVKPSVVQSLQNLSTSSTGKSRQNGEISGVLKADFRLNFLLKQVIDTQIGENGYVYLVDDKGAVLAHPNSGFVKRQANFSNVPEVASFIRSISSNSTDVTASTTLNENNKPFLTSHAQILPMHWGVIGEIPLTDTFAAANQVALFAAVLLLIFLCIVFLVSLWVAGKIVHPIKLLQEGADLIGNGRLDYRFHIKTGDEIEDLALSFNFMAANLYSSIGQISAERNKLEVILSGISDAVIALDTHRNIITVNRAAEQLLGYTASQILGKPAWEIFKFYDQGVEITGPVYAPENRTGFEGIAFSQSKITIVSAHKTAHVNLICGQIKEGAHINLGGILTLHDITQEQQLEEMKLDFVSMAVHELRTPLTSLKGYIYIYLRDYKDALDEKQTSVMNRINISTQKLVSLVENLLNITRIERGALNLHLEPVDWVSNVQDVISDINNIAKDKKIEISFQPPVNPIPPLQVDKFRIDEVLTNLLSNAINYTEPGGNIKVSIERYGGQVVTQVKDSGQGIPVEALPHLFTKFFRVNGKLEQGTKGTGLGLYIAKSIIKMHNGSIWAESGGRGKGSTFSFSLPI